jgi:hypothetical protein
MLIQDKWITGGISFENEDTFLEYIRSTTRHVGQYETLFHLHEVSNNHDRMSQNTGLQPLVRI